MTEFGGENPRKFIYFIDFKELKTVARLEFDVEKLYKIYQ